MRLLLGVLVAGHLVVAMAWWWMMPGGFPVGHARWWLNGVIPWLVAASMALALRFWIRLAPTAVVALGFVWLGAAISGRVIYPISARGLWVLPLAGAAILLVIGTSLGRGSAPLVMRWLVIVGSLGIGAAVPALSHPRTAATHPSKAPSLAFEQFSPPLEDGKADSIMLNPMTEFAPAEGELFLRQSERWGLVVRPLLTFRSRSPDGCWTLFARNQERVGPLRRLVGFSHADGFARADYVDDARSFLKVTSGADGRSIDGEAGSELPQVVWSHLNSYLVLRFYGGAVPAIGFSPCPSAIVEIVKSDYPIGRPSRFAYVDAAGRFHVVEASSAEKGPFRELASGQLADTDPLIITLYDGSVPTYRCTLSDFARLASRELSPTAGWGVSANSIEFFQETDGATVFISLASTSVGRGFDSVGHAPGVYRNRFLIESLR